MLTLSRSETAQPDAGREHDVRFSRVSAEIHATHREDHDVLGLPDDAHRTRAELADDLVALRGGAAGRKKTGRRHDPPHRVRPDLSSKHPVHVVLRAKRRISWRTGQMYRVLWRVLCAFLGRDDFRVVHISIQRNHLHLLVEARDRHALTEGIKSFATRVARAFHRELGGSGKVFPFRYFANQIKTARYARHALAYVLCNWRRHREDFANGRALAAKLDEYSSALSFDGWTMRFAVPESYEPLPVSAPHTALLRSQWQEHGRIDPGECPGPLW